MARNYYDPTLFRSAEESLNIYWPDLPTTAQYMNLPTTTYAQYKAEVETQYNNLTPLLKTICDFHMSALTEVVSSGITTDPDYWSASSVNGTFIVNSGLTTSKVGIGTTIPNHTLSVSGSVSASSFVYASTVDTSNLKIAGAQGSDGQVLTSTGSGVAWEDSSGGGGSSYWAASSVDGTFIINSGVTSTANPNKVGVGTMIPNKELSVSGSISASTSIFVGSDCIIKSPESGSVFIGDDAGANWESNSVSNTALGRLAMGTGTMSTAVQNTALGFAAFAGVTTGDYNTAVGLQSLSSSDTGAFNTALGKTAMFGTTYHSYNVGIGANALYFTTSSSLGKTVTTNTHNTAVGYSSQYYSINGIYNTSVGSQTLGNGGISVAGTGNTVMGFEAMKSSQIGSYNLALGYKAGDNITTGDYNISIGPNVDPESATADYQMNVGGAIIGKDLVGDNLSINAVGIGTAVTSSLLTHTFTVSGDTLINGDLVCSGDIDGGTF
tara:strand:+ start:4272 stop:5756 length:1485 start_codon:yes stop_codon:yes gene_type:complete